MPCAKNPIVSSDRASDSENAYSPAIVEKRFPPSIVNDASNKKGSVATASAAGTGRGARKSLAMMYAVTGINTDPRIVASLKAIAKLIT